MQPLRLATAQRVHTSLRSLIVLLTCLGLAAASLAAAGGSRKNPGASVVAAAKEHLGDPYVWGGAGPNAWDCSGLTSRLWRGVGGVKDIPRTSQQQQAWAVPLPVEQVEPGDLVFFGDPVNHVGIVEKRVTTKSGTTVTMLDASSSQHGVVRRTAWTSGVVRYGRVPRRGMMPVTPWTPPSPGPTASAKPSREPSSQSSSKPSSQRAPKPTATAAGKPQGHGAKPPLQGLPRTQKAPSSAIALKAVKLAKAALGNTRLTDVELVRNVWRRAGGTALPSSRSGLSGAAHRVPLGDARVGDLIVYAAPASHVGIYVGHGMMVDASRSLGKVVLRQVWAARGVQVQRLKR